MERAFREYLAPRDLNLKARTLWHLTPFPIFTPQTRTSDNHVVRLVRCVASLKVVDEDR